MAANKTFTINMKPVDGHLEVTIPEIGATVCSSGATLRDAEEAGLYAITGWLEKPRHRRRVYQAEGLKHDRKRPGPARRVRQNDRKPD